MNFCGGAEAVALSLAKLLKEEGYDIKLVTADRPDWKKIESILNYSIEVKQEYKLKYDITDALNPVNVSRLVLAYKALLEEHKDDLLINMYGDLDIFMNKGDIIYINGIPFSIISRDRAPIYLNGIISKIYNLFTKHEHDNILISNSFYTQEIIKERLNIESLVIHPPPTIDSSKIVSREKEDMVLTMSRIVRGKKLERVLSIAERMKGIRFVIIGRMYDKEYYEELMSRRLDNLTFLINKPRSIMLDCLARAKILLHTMDHETFGLSIIEGMLARCIPLVPRNGGPWIDILDKKDGLYGYSYDSIDTAIDRIEMLLSNGDSIAERAYQRASLLSREFYDRFPKIIESRLS